MKRNRQVINAKTYRIGRALWRRWGSCRLEPAELDTLGRAWDRLPPFAGTSTVAQSIARVITGGELQRGPEVAYWDGLAWDATDDGDASRYAAVASTIEEIPAARIAAYECRHCGRAYPTNQNCPTCWEG